MRDIINFFRDPFGSIQREIEKWIEDIFALISEMLLGALNPRLSSVGGLDTAGLSPGAMITTHPAQWNDNVWGMVRGISETAIVPIAMMILMIVLVTDLVQTLTAGNQFENVGIAPFVKWTIKTMVGITLVSNIFTIAAAIFTFGAEAGVAGIEMLNRQSLDFTVNLSNGSFNLGTIIVVWFISFLTLIGVCLLIIAILVALTGRMIDIFMYLSVAPLTAATFMNSEWRNTSNNWVKGMVALAFQGFFIIIAIAIFAGLFGNICAVINMEGTTVTNTALIFNMLILLAYTLSLIMTVLRSGSISKSIFGAS